VFIPFLLRKSLPELPAVNINQAPLYYRHFTEIVNKKRLFFLSF